MAEYVIKVTTTGGAGVAGGTGLSEEPIRGPISSIRVAFHASAPATTTVDVDEVGGQARKVLDLAAGNTADTYFPRITADSVAGVAEVPKSEWFVIPRRYLQVTVALSDALVACVVVTIVTMD